MILKSFLDLYNIIHFPLVNNHGKQLPIYPTEIMLDTSSLDKCNFRNINFNFSHHESFS